MRKSIKIALIVASSLVGFGILCLCLSFALGGVDLMFKPSPKSDFKAMSATFDEVDIIDIDERSNNVRILKSDDNQVKVSYTVCEDYSYYIRQVDNKLYIEFNDNTKWYNRLFYFGFYWDTDLVVEVPENTLEELNVKSTSGSIEAKEVDSLVTTLKSTSGSIKVGGSVGDLTANATSGSVMVCEGTEAELMYVGSTSGKLSVNGTVKGDVIADNTSGGIVLTNLKCENVNAKTTSGRIKGENLELTSVKADSVSGGVDFENVICTEDMTLEATSGSLNLEAVDAKNYDLQSTSGSIKAEILTPKLYNTKSNSGIEKTPDLDPSAEGVLNAKTTSGNIKIKLAD